MNYKEGRKEGRGERVIPGVKGDENNEFPETLNHLPKVRVFF